MAPDFMRSPMQVSSCRFFTFCRVWRVGRSGSEEHYGPIGSAKYFFGNTTINPSIHSRSAVGGHQDAVNMVFLGKIEDYISWLPNCDRTIHIQSRKIRASTDGSQVLERFSFPSFPLLIDGNNITADIDYSSDRRNHVKQDQLGIRHFGQNESFL